MAEETNSDLGRAALRLMETLLETEEREGLTLKHLRLLQLLDRETRRTCTSLCEVTGWPPSTVSRLLADLAAYSERNHPPLITYSLNPENRREKLIVKTEAAIERQQRIEQSLRQRLPDEA